MTTEKMTIHKALSELKILDNRIAKALDIPLVFANKHSNGTVKGLTVAAYSAEIKAAYKSATDLIARRSAIKRAVMISNATTKVAIGGEEYTVSEAIETKNHTIPVWRHLLQKMQIDETNARTLADRNNGDSLENRADSYVKSLYENADMKNLSEEVKRVRADFIASQTMEIVDPINITDEMKRLSDKIDAFTVDVDSALSVSNAMTKIEISY